MALSFYDKALVAKIKKWVTNTTIQVTGPDETSRLFEIHLNDNNDRSIELPLIAIRRGKGFTLLSTNKKPLTFDGLTLEAYTNETASKSIQLNAIPVSIPYQIDIYTRYFQEADEYVRNFIFNIINFPKLPITIPYNNTNIELNSNIRISPEVSDNSDIPERLITGQFSRFTLNITVDDAYLFDVRVRDNYSIELSKDIIFD